MWGVRLAGDGGGERGGDPQGSEQSSARDGSVVYKKSREVSDVCGPELCRSKNNVPQS